jgi:hypothetical protein
MLSLIGLGSGGHLGDIGRHLIEARVQEALHFIKLCAQLGRLQLAGHERGAALQEVGVARQLGFAVPLQQLGGFVPDIEQSISSFVDE